jgi:hypothetical protein
MDQGAAALPGAHRVLHRDRGRPSSRLAGTRLSRWHRRAARGSSSTRRRHGADHDHGQLARLEPSPSRRHSLSAGGGFLAPLRSTADAHTHARKVAPLSMVNSTHTARRVHATARPSTLIGCSGNRTHASIATGSDSAEVTGSSPSSDFDNEIGAGFTMDSFTAAQVRSEPYRLFCPNHPHRPRYHSNTCSNIKSTQFTTQLDPDFSKFGPVNPRSIGSAPYR